VSNSDYFLDNPPLQPKRDVAKYIAHCGFCVPHIFDNKSDALTFIDNGGSIIMRSEHVDEYSGMAGLRRSYIVNSGLLSDSKKYCSTYGTAIDWKLEHGMKPITRLGEARKKIFNQMTALPQKKMEQWLTQIDMPLLKMYTKLKGEEWIQFQNKASYSYWEYIEGINCYIIADNAIQNRYHIFMEEPYVDGGEQGSHKGYFLVDGSDISYNGYDDAQWELTAVKNIERIINFYNSVRHLERFNANHCPIMELQITKSEIYFLQYHRSRDIELATFELTRNATDNEVDALLVRGSTPPEGIILQTHAYYKDFIIQPEDASFDLHYNFAFTEIMTRQRKCMFITQPELAWINLELQTGHLLYSTLFNPQVSVILPKEYTDSLHLKDLYKKTKPGQPASLTFRVISDGRKGYIKQL